MFSKQIKKQTSIVLILLLVCFSCYEDVVHEETQEEQTKKINDWIYQTLATYYYWNNELPSSSLDYFLSPTDFFSSLLSSKDKFSWITNSKQNNLNQLQGVRKNYGFEYVLGYTDDTRNDLIGIILYVHKGTHAETVGIKRGDVFYEVNNIVMNIYNVPRFSDSELRQKSFNFAV
jgi:hypothetical protein